MEPQTHGIERLLECRDGQYVMAGQLAAMAKEYGFDGWLLNIEEEFPMEIKQGPQQLVNFAKALTILMGTENLVVWYDALTVENRVKYQNGLTEKNLDFAKVTDAFFTNYRWVEENTAESIKMAENNHVNTMDIYFGIDVWAQNTNMSGPPRITFPPEDGGGTNTGFVRIFFRPRSRRAFLSFVQVLECSLTSNLLTLWVMVDIYKPSATSSPTVGACNQTRVEDEIMLNSYYSPSKG